MGTKSVMDLIGNTPLVELANAAATAGGVGAAYPGPHM